MEVILAIDPGSHKCGLAVVGRDGVVLDHGVSTVEQVDQDVARLVVAHQPRTVLLGNGTAMKMVRQRLHPETVLRGTPLVVVDEKHTTEKARLRYFKDHPPRGLRRLLPLGLQVPPQPYDDYAAVVLAEAYLASQPTPTD